MNFFVIFITVTMKRAGVVKFAESISSPTSFVNKVSDFGDHSNRTASHHLSTSQHQNAVKNKLAFKELSLRQTNVFQLLHEASLATNLQKRKPKGFVIKKFFWITWVLISNNWTGTLDFWAFAELLSKYGGKELQNHLLTSPQNARYMSPDYLQKYIQIMDDYLKVPL